MHRAQSFSNRAPRGRKHDFKDAERLICRLIAKRLVLSFVPDGELPIWQNLTRIKLQLVRVRVRVQSQIGVCWKRCASSGRLSSAICWDRAAVSSD
jgi:hypothetical protein